MERGITDQQDSKRTVVGRTQRLLYTAVVQLDEI